MRWRRRRWRWGGGGGGGWRCRLGPGAACVAGRCGGGGRGGPGGGRGGPGRGAGATGRWGGTGGRRGGGGAGARRGAGPLACGPAGVFRVRVAVVAVAVMGWGALLLALPGAGGRAMGGDWEGSAGAGVRPLGGTLAALAVSGGLAGLGGALAVHAT